MSYMYQALASLGQTPRDTARALYDEGSSAYDAGNYILAERKFREAYDTMPNAVVLTAIARSVEAQGRTYEAYQLYERYLAQEPEGSAAQRARDGMERTRPPKLPSTTVPATSSKPVSKPLPAPSVDKPAATLEQAEQEGKGASIAVWVVTGAGVLGLLGLGYLLTRPTKRPVAANRRRRRRRRRRR